MNGFALDICERIEYWLVRKFCWIDVDFNIPAAAAGFTRGTKILTIDGEDVENGSNTTVLNNGLFPNGENEDHTFEIELLDGTRQTVTVTSASVAEMKYCSLNFLSNSLSVRIILSI